MDDRVALQGNIDPSILSSSLKVIQEEVKSILKQFGKRPEYIFNLDHGITTDIPPEHVALLVNTVHEFSER